MILKYLRKFTFFIFLLLVLIQLVSAQDSNSPAVPGEEKPAVEVEKFIPAYDLGDQIFTLNAGVFLPLFFQSSDWEYASTKDHLTVGGTAALGWYAFLHPNLTLGIELGGMFAFTPNRTLFMIPLIGNFAYTFRFYPFEVPIHIGYGLNFTKIDEYLYVGMILKPGVGFYGHITPEWAIGGKVQYWWVPEIYFGDQPPKEQTRFGNFMDITVSAHYYF